MLLRITLAALLFTLAADRTAADWPVWGGDPGSAHYSKLADINSANVSKLRQAWTWKTGETEFKGYGTRPGMFENTPLVIDNVMYVTSPYNEVVALDDEKGTV